MSRIRSIALAGVIMLAASLLLARVHPFGDAGLYAAQRAQTSAVQSASFSPEVRALLNAKCADCHSAQTRAPLYGRFAPASWLMERDIVEARKRLDLSVWDSYPNDRQEALKAAILSETLTHRMPLPQYTAIHRQARISESDLQALRAWISQGQAVEVATVQLLTAAGDPASGKDVFDRRCSGCHAMTQDGEGPHLKGVYGRTSGTRDGYLYSPALKKAKIVWNDQSLEQWLTDPDTLVPGNSMEFHVPKAQERRDLISYLKQSSP